MQPTTHAPILLPPMHCDARTTPKLFELLLDWLGSGEAYEISRQFRWRASLHEATRQRPQRELYVAHCEAVVCVLMPACTSLAETVLSVSPLIKNDADCNADWGGGWWELHLLHRVTKSSTMGQMQLHCRMRKHSRVNENELRSATRSLKRPMRRSTSGDQSLKHVAGRR